MDSETEIKHHPNGIWYSFSGQRTWYIPYLTGLQRQRAGKWSVAWNGGEDLIEMKRAGSIMFYGANARTGDLPLQFLDECRQYGVTVSVHRNHISEPFVFAPLAKEDRDDVLSQQILARTNEKKAAYIARSLVKAQWEGRLWRAGGFEGEKALSGSRNVAEVMRIEAQAARAYWEVFYRGAGLHHLSRRETHPINAALDAVSHFQSGMLLRWIVAHGLSPAHGFLHTATSYPALVYDLMEPVRWIGEQAVFDEWVGNPEVDTLADRAAQRLKSLLAEPIDVEPTRQRVYRKTLLHGQVIALRRYLLESGKHTRYLPPFERRGPAVGRKRKVNYQLPGQIWTR